MDLAGLDWAECVRAAVPRLSNEGDFEQISVPSCSYRGSIWCHTSRSDHCANHRERDSLRKMECLGRLSDVATENRLQNCALSRRERGLGQALPRSSAGGDGIGDAGTA